MSSDTQNTSAALHNLTHNLTHTGLRSKQSAAHDYGVLAAFIIGHQAIAYILGIVTRTEITQWYAGLEKSSLTPPDWVFGLTWAVLFFMISVSGWLLYKNRHKKGADTAAVFFGLQLIFNWSWTIVFFSYHLILPAAVWIAGLIILLSATMLTLRHVSGAAVLWLVPYLLWISFAFYLNLAIWVLN